MHTFYSYETAAMRSVNMTNSAQANLINAALGLTGEAGEVADLVKKHIYHGHKLDVDKLVKELGDVLWYIAQACYALQVPMDDVAMKNIEKLLERYPVGFSPERSLNRRVGE
jgi:NTP pyrophosphatase (non-canonical NTP hydrolase)